MTTPLSPEEQVRLHLGERIPVNGFDTDTFFSNAEIATLLSTANDNVNAAVALGWWAKAAEFASLVDTDESGSSRKMSQLHKQAVLQAKHYEELAGAEVVAATEAARVIGKTVPWLQERGSVGVVYAYPGPNRA